MHKHFVQFWWAHWKKRQYFYWKTGNIKAIGYAERASAVFTEVGKKVKRYELAGYSSQCRGFETCTALQLNVGETDVVSSKECTQLFWYEHISTLLKIERLCTSSTNPYFWSQNWLAVHKTESRCYHFWQYVGYKRVVLRRMVSRFARNLISLKCYLISLLFIAAKPAPPHITQSHNKYTIQPG